MDFIGKRAGGSNDGTEGDEHNPKQHKGEQNGTLDEESFPQTRRVIMRFSSLGVDIPARIVYRENFGILAKAEEATDSVEIGDRFWTKWCGALAPLSRTPIVEVVHAVKH
jgi:hypothetical protein